MSKKKKLRTSGEGIRPLKPPKNPRLGDSDTVSQRFNLGLLRHPEESDGRSGPAPSAEQSQEEPGQVASSSLDKEAGAPSRLLTQLEKEPLPFPSSQNSVGRFVPQFAKSKKAVTRLAAAREEDLQRGAFSSETLPEPSAQQAGSQSWEEESPGLTVWEAKEPGDQTQADGTHSEHNIQNPVTLVSSRGNSQPEVSKDASLERGLVPSASGRASQNSLLEQGTEVRASGSTEEGGILGGHSREGHQLSSGTKEEEPDRGASQKEGAQGGAGADQEKGDSILGLATQGSEPGSAALAAHGPLQTLSRAGRGAERNYGSPRCSYLRILGNTDVTPDSTKPEQRALEVAGPGGEANAGAPISPSGKAPGGGHSGPLMRGMPLNVETTGSRGEAGWEVRAPGDILEGPVASLALHHGMQEPIMGAADSSPVASEKRPVIDQTHMLGLDQEGLRGICVLPLLSQPSGEQGGKLRSQSHKQNLGELRLSLGASAPPLHREAIGGPSWDAKAQQGSSNTLTGPGGQPDHHDSADQAGLEGSPTMQLNFLPDSQITGALEVPSFETPPKQLFPTAGSGVGPWPGTSLRTNRRSLSEAQPSTSKAIKPCEATRMEDATATVRGLVVELSHLNRLIMTAHRDLEAFKHFSYRKVKPEGKLPTPNTSKGAGTLPGGEQSWRDL